MSLKSPVIYYRAGRCRPGLCYHMFSKIRHTHLQDYATPEILRLPLQVSSIYYRTIQQQGHPKIFEIKIGCLLELQHSCSSQTVVYCIWFDMYTHCWHSQAEWWITEVVCGHNFFLLMIITIKYLVWEASILIWLVTVISSAEMNILSDFCLVSYNAITTITFRYWKAFWIKRRK